MGNSSRHINGRSRQGLDLSVDKSDGQRSLKDVPGLIVSVVDMQVVGAASAPLVNIMRSPSSQPASSRRALCEAIYLA